MTMCGGGGGGGGGGGEKGRAPVTMTEDELRALTAHLVVKVRSDAPDIQAQLERALVAMLWQGDGLYEVRRTPIMQHVRQLAKADTPGLPNVVAEGFALRITPMPKHVLQQVVSFFGAVQEAHKAEAMVQLFWQPPREGVAGQWVVSVPPQEVSGAHVDHTGPLPEVADLVPIGEIHSHSSMGAFWSGTDDNDEKRSPMRLFGVIGNLDHLSAGKMPSWKWRIFTGSAFVDLELAQLCDLSEPWTLRVTLADVLRGTVNVAACPEALQAEVPAAWMAQVREKRANVVRYTPGERMGYAYQGSPRSAYGLDDDEWWGYWRSERERPTIEVARPEWAIREGITEEAWKELVARDDRQQSRLTKRQQRRAARKAKDRAMTEEPPDRPSNLDSTPIGSIVFRGGQWWKKGTDGVWRLDTYDPRKGWGSTPKEASKEEQKHITLNWRDYVDVADD